MHHTVRPNGEVIGFLCPWQGAGNAAEIAAKGTAPHAEVSVLALAAALLQVQCRRLGKLCPPAGNVMPFELLAQGAAQLLFNAVEFIAG